VKMLFDVLIGGKDLADFHEGFPTVKPEQSVAVLKLAYEAVIKSSSR